MIRPLLVLAAVPFLAFPAGPQLVEVQGIWGQAAHNAYPDLARFKGRWYCALREGTAADSPDGSIRVLTSADGERWLSAVVIPSSVADLRDPKFSITPDHRLMLNAVAVFPQSSEVRRRSLAWFSSDGRDWAAPAEIAEPNVELGRVVWQASRAYSTGSGRLYTSRDGLSYSALAGNLAEEARPEEASVLFLNDDSAVCLMRRGGPQGAAMLGRARPPYLAWTWKDLGLNLRDCSVLRLEDGRIVAAGNAGEGKGRTALFWLDAEEGSLKQFLALPSGGESGHPGLVFYEGMLWVSYHSSHEGRTRVYVARVKLGG